jgi:DNA-binding CsgD family transcriptional regulator
MCDELQQLSLIGEIYDAAESPSSRVEVLAKIAHFVGGVAATLSVKGAAGTYTQDCGIDSRFRQLYFDHDISIILSSTARLTVDIDEPFAWRDIADHDLLASRFYQEWMQPQRLVDCVTYVLDRAPTGTAMIHVFRHERDGVADERARRRMRFIGPHVRRAVRLGKLIATMMARRETYAGVLDGISAGVFLVDAGAHIIYANIAGRAILEAGELLRADGGRVVAIDRQANEALRRSLATAGSGDPLGRNSIAVPLTTRAGEHYMAQLLLLTRAVQPRPARGPSSKAFAVLLVRKAALEAPLLEALAKSYALTPAELRILRAVVDLGGIPDVAQAFGLAPTTVKTHLQRLYRKTGAKRHADLVKLVAGFSNPLVSSGTPSQTSSA